MTTTGTDATATLAALEERVRRLEGVEGVWRLFQEYRRLLDLRDFAAYSRLFTDDGEWVGDLGSAKGPAEIEALLVRTLEVYEDDTTRTYHLVANPVVDVDGDRATATSMWCFLTRGDGDSPVLEMVGHYVDTLVCEGGAWKFARRVAYRDMPYVALDPAR
jgi:ketosteroid isomerase-like protein